MKIPLNTRLILFVTLATSWFTGFGFFLLDTFFQIEGEFGVEKHPFQNTALTLHGAAAFLMMIWFGGLVATHVPMGWRTKRLRFWGLSLITGLCLQIFTAYCLYYLANELARDVVKWVHLGIGLILPAILTGHILAGISHHKNHKNHSKKPK
ncbi:MAG: hypothetical protein COA69_07000 [Robiginitomaculum sp.]|nr:MAG: hypothetical protein COA69_07000 [Robiginitomaculum sp.]